MRRVYTSTCQHVRMIVAVVNQKGGVGKTATTLGIVSTLARRDGRRVLVVDLDPQANATTALGIDATPDGFDVGDVLYADTEGVAAEAITKSSWGDEVVCIPSSLAVAEREYDTKLGSELRLRKALKGVGGFDVAILDCPPNVGKLVQNGLIAATHVLIVTEAETDSLRGVANVLRTIDVVKEGYNPALTTAGIVVNNMPPNQNEANYRLSELTQAFGSLVWEPPLPRRAVVTEARGAAAPIHDFASRARDVVAVYQEFTDRLLDLGGLR